MAIVHRLPAEEKVILPGILLFAATKVVLNSSYRMVYPLLPVFARGLGVDIAAIARALTLRSAAGACGTLLAPVSDRFGRRAGMLLGLVLFSAGAALVTVFPAFWCFVAALSCMLVGKYVFDPAVQAYVGESVPYARRGFTIAVTELGWSLAFLAGVPACAWAIGRFGWAVPFPAFTALGLIAAVLHGRIVREQSGARYGTTRLRDTARALAASPPALYGLAVGLLATVGNELVNIVFGVWIESTFRVSLEALGAAAMGIGAAELCGEVLAGVMSDRLGKGRSVMAALLLNGVAGLLLLLLGGSLAGALAGLFFFYLTFEFGMVSLTPLLTELFPGARATFMGATVAAFSIGRALGALLAIPLYSGGLWRTVFAAIIFNLCACAVLACIREGSRKGTLAREN